MHDKFYRSIRKKKTFIILVVLIFLFYTINVQAYADEKVVNEIKDILNQYYIEDVTNNILNNNSVNDIMNNLKDPYTQVMDWDDYNSYLNNTFLGIGVNIKMVEEGVVVSSVIVNSPAMESGLKEGDVIIAVDNNYIKGYDADNALKILNGKPGVKSELKIIRKNSEILISIVPGTVYYPSVYSKIVNGSTAYINIICFNENTLSEFKYILDSEEMKTVNSFIIDLRNNLGGYIYSALEIAGYFVGNNNFAIAKNKYGVEYKLNAIGKDKVIDGTTIFLVNKYTASAAEVLTACVQDYNKAVIVGEKTYGKGVAQSAFKLSDGSILKTTTLRLYSPNGKDINNVGISPDIYINGMDPLIVVGLITSSNNILNGNYKIAKTIINNKNYYINIDNIKNDGSWEAYRQIISQAGFIDISNSSLLSQRNNSTNNCPIIRYTEVPKVEYKAGDRVSFKVSSPNYNGYVQYRAMIWDETTNQYTNLWNTKDFYYDKWKPRGKDVFTISLPINKAGNYRIKIFAKRSGIANSKTALKGMNCDSYVYEIPFRVSGS